MIEFNIILVLMFMYLKSVMDAIAHHDYFKRHGYSKFFWKETYEASKTNWFHKNFPMFYDAWHLSSFLMVCEFCFICSLFAHNILLFPILVIIGSLFFNFLYSFTK